jgi:hypothetical protein
LIILLDFLLIAIKLDFLYAEVNAKIAALVAERGL